MFKSAPRVDRAPTSVGVAEAAPIPYFDSRSSITSVTTKTALGPSSVTVPSGSGYLSFPSGDGELSVGPADAHQRSEAAYPIVQSFVSVVKKPENVESKLTIAKGQPILFLPVTDEPKDDEDKTTVRSEACIKGKNKQLADRRYKGACKYVAIVGKNKDVGEMLLSSGYMAFAAEPTVVQFDASQEYSVMTSIACAIEYESDVLATSVPLNDAGSEVHDTKHYPAGTAIMAGIFYDGVGATGSGWDPTGPYCIRACAGFPSELHNLCSAGQFVPKRCATAIVPFVALPMKDGDLTVVPPVRAAVIARPFPSTVM
jgi:hypothetical protein